VGAARVIGRFELQDQIGEGGAARVYRAIDLTNGQPVAVKLLKRELSGDRESLERLQREAFAVASLSSPHLVGLCDFGMTGDEAYLALQLVEGTMLRTLCDHEPWPSEKTRVVIGHVAAALGEAHAHGVLHRDLKPENVMLTRGTDGRVRAVVIDFGMARLVELEEKLGLERLTQAGSLFGTPQYIAPEAIRGDPVDARVDLFALAVITYELLAGHRPWDGLAPPKILRSILDGAAPAIERAHPSITDLGRVNAFLQRALAKDPADRPADAAHFFAELQAALTGTPAQVDEQLFQAVSATSIPVPETVAPTRQAEPRAIQRTVVDDDREPTVIDMPTPRGPRALVARYWWVGAIAAALLFALLFFAIR
jgi:serine/threonine-protein kinase